MKIEAVKCKKCSEIIYSRAHHDFHYCSCGSTFVDGGRDYLRYGFSPNIGEPEVIEIEIDATESEMYQDWNKSLNKLGTVKE